MELLDDRYELLAELGRGSAAAVYRARDQQLDREVAVKLLTGGSAVADPARFLVEAQVLASLRHPHIVEIYAMGTYRRAPFLVTELVTGGSLEARYGKQEFTQAAVVDLGEKLLLALAAAHEAGVCHRDVKPANVLLTASDDPKLADFGLAKHGGSQVRTASGMLLGTPDFMAPELFQGEAAGPAADLFSWGVLASYLLNRTLPFPSDLSEGTKAKFAGSFRAGRERGGLQRALAQALRADPEARGTAQALRKVLLASPLGDARQAATRKLTGAALPAATASRPEAPPESRSRWLAWGALMAGLVLAGVTLPDPGAAPVVVIPEAGSGVAEQVDLVAHWVQKLATVETRGLIAGLHPKMIEDNPFLGAFAATHYPNQMVETRRGTRSDAKVELLSSLRAELPYRAELRRDLVRLNAAMENRQVPYATRKALARGLLPLLHLDVYYDCWGLLPPYGVRRVLDSLQAVEWIEPDPGWTPAGPLPRRGEIGPGRYALFRWPAATAPWPILFANEAEGPPSAYEQQGLGKYPVESQGSFVAEEHQEILVSFALGDSQVDSAARYSVVLQAGGLFVGNCLEVAWDDLRAYFYADPNRHARLIWDNDAIPEYLIRVEVPREALTEGVHTLRLRVRPLPGLPRFGAISLDHVELWAENSHMETSGQPLGD